MWARGGPAAWPDGLRHAAVIPSYDAMKWLGCAISGISLLCVAPLYWPMWGGMFMPAKAGYTEEDYYYKEYTADEREKGLHLANSAFVRPPLACWFALHSVCSAQGACSRAWRARCACVHASCAHHTLPPVQAVSSLQPALEQWRSRHCLAGHQLT